MEETSAPPKVTVLVVTYNQAGVLRRSLEALQASQGRDQFEVIVVDNGSVDDTPQLDAEFPNITFMRLPRYFGATKALNIGMRTAVGDFVLFLSPDVVVEPATVMALLARIEPDDSIAGVCPMLVDESGAQVPQARRLPDAGMMSRLWHDPEALAPAAVDVSQEAVPVGYPGRRAVMYRKFFIRALNWLDERFGDYGADLDLAFQVRRSQRRILLFPAIRATVLPGGEPVLDKGADASLSADRAHGSAVFLAKHFGWFSGFKLRVGAILHVTGKLLTFQNPGFQFGRLSALVGGAKIDGTQRTI